jgi:DNA-binding protein YbaB
MREVKTIKLENEQIRIVFTNEANPDESELVMALTVTKDGDKKVTSVGLDPSLIDREVSFMGEMYMKTIDVLYAVKKIFDAGETYEGLHVLTKEEYKQYLIKVKGLKIED